MAEWKGKSRGSVSGLKVFVFFIKHFGLRAAYILLCLPVPYFVFSAPKASKSIFAFFHKRLGYSKFYAFFQIFKSYYVFGQTLIDRIAVTVGHRDKFTYEFDGVHHIENLLKKGEGGILFTAHIGNFNISRTFFETLENPAKINMVVTDLEHENIKEYLESVTGKTNLNLIVVEEDLSHIFKINEALQNNELLVFAADRSGEGKSLTQEFLGKEAAFFSGPFKLVAKKKLPVLFVHIMREKGFHYHLYARPCETEINSEHEILKLYTDNLAKMVKKYPNQWFNFYDYWADFKKEKLKN